jgi:hypothetical protein
LSIAPASLAASNSYQASQSDNGWQQFAQLVSAVNAGNLSASQKAYANFTQSPAAEVAKTNPDSRIAQALKAIGPALQASDIGKAQQALASLRPGRPPGAQPSGGRGPSTAAPSTAAPSIVPADPNAPGAKLNLTV